MGEKIGFQVRRDFEDALDHREPARVPTIFWGGAPFVARFMGVREKDYYHNSDVKLRCTLGFQELFAEMLMLPGVYAYFGPIVEASAFGSQISWPVNGPPWAPPVLSDIKEVDNLKVPDPKTAGLMPRVLEECRYFWQHIDRYYIEAYGYLDGVAHCLGPLQVASEVRGHANLFLDFYDDPQRVHKLLEITTETLINWLHALEKVNGKLKRLILVDHIPGQISAELFEEFFFPYAKRVYDEFADAPVRMYHNEDGVRHVMHRIPDLGANVFHFGEVDMVEVKEKIGDRVCLMGNLHPVKTLLNGSVKDVRRETGRCLEFLSPGGGYFLCSGGGMAPGTSKEKLEVMLEETRKRMK